MGVRADVLCGFTCTRRPVCYTRSREAFLTWTCEEEPTMIEPEKTQRPPKAMAHCAPARGWCLASSRSRWPFCACWACWRFTFPYLTTPAAAQELRRERSSAPSCWRPWPRGHLAGQHPVQPSPVAGNVRLRHGGLTALLEWAQGRGGPQLPRTTRPTLVWTGSSSICWAAR